MKKSLSYSYGISQLRSPQREHANKSVTSFSALQERAKQFFNDSNATDNVSQMLQLIEDFCREGDKLIEEENDAKKNLQAQVTLRILFDAHNLSHWFACGFGNVSHIRSSNHYHLGHINRLVLLNQDPSNKHK